MTWINPPTKFTATVTDDASAAAKRIGIKVLRSLISDSPVDTGRFRGNWVVGLKQPDTGIKDIVADPLSAGIRLIKLHKDFHPLFISNNLPYARALNDGWSEQAPANFVEMAIARSIK